jgi:hypothetical protein
MKYEPRAISLPKTVSDLSSLDSGARISIKALVTRGGVRYRVLLTLATIIRTA